VRNPKVFALGVSIFFKYFRFDVFNSIRIGKYDEPSTFGLPEPLEFSSLLSVQRKGNLL
jgi:hypothetical protein